LIGLPQQIIIVELLRSLRIFNESTEPSKPNFSKSRKFLDLHFFHLKGIGGWATLSAVPVPPLDRVIVHGSLASRHVVLAEDIEVIVAMNTSLPADCNLLFGKNATSWPQRIAATYGASL
jgi:hypothetical protein